MQTIILTAFSLINGAAVVSAQFSYSKNSQIDVISVSIDVTKVDVDEEKSEITQDLLITMEFHDSALVVDNDAILSTKEAKEIRIPELVTQSNQKITNPDVNMSLA